MNSNNPIDNTWMPSHSPNMFAARLFVFCAMILAICLFAVHYGEKAYDNTASLIASGKIQRMVSQIEDPRYRQFNAAVRKIERALR